MNNCECMTWASTDISKRFLSTNDHHENCEHYNLLPEWCMKCAEEIEGLKRHYPAVAKTARTIYHFYRLRK